MAKSKALIEKEIKRIITGLHKEVFGKGPEELWVKIHRNVATFSCTKTLTPLENYLQSTPEGDNEIARIRMTISKTAKTQLCSEIELACGLRVLGITDEIYICSDVLYGAILFQENIDN